MIAGPSQYGKTTFTKQLLEQVDSLFERLFVKLYIAMDNGRNVLETWQLK